MTTAEELRKYADKALREGGIMYFSDEYLDALASRAEAEQAENEKLRELVRAFWWCTENPDGPYECHRCPLSQSSETECECEVIMRELGIEVEP